MCCSSRAAVQCRLPDVKNLRNPSPDKSGTSLFLRQAQEREEPRVPEICKFDWFLYGWLLGVFDFEYVDSSGAARVAGVPTPGNVGKYKKLQGLQFPCSGCMPLAGCKKYKKPYLRQLTDTSLSLRQARGREEPRIPEIYVLISFYVIDYQE